MVWRMALSLDRLKAQLRAKWPKRSTVSDGGIGDAAHASRSSDHNPYIKDQSGVGVVRAFDITNDPVNGPPLEKLIPLFLKDNRTRYVIFNKKIYNPAIQGGAARPYTGTNAHQKHLHLSVSEARAHYDDARDWVLAGATPTDTRPAASTPAARSTLKKGMTGGDVPTLQLFLRAQGFYKGLVDGNFGPKTEAAVKAAQARLGLKATGVVDTLTWERLAAQPTSALEQTVNAPAKAKTVPEQAIATFESLGWSHIQAVALVANLIWESGGNNLVPAKSTIKFDAHGDKDKTGVYRSHGAGQWNEKAGRFGLLTAFAEKRGKLWSDPETQIAFLSHELETTEKRAGAALKAATTIEDAVTAAIGVWRPSVPHADKRLAIARTLLK